jgi:hypothetical protein
MRNAAAHFAHDPAPCCTIHQARKEDWLAKIADRTVFSIGQLLSDDIPVTRTWISTCQVWQSLLTAAAAAAGYVTTASSSQAPFHA